MAPSEPEASATVKPNPSLTLPARIYLPKISFLAFSMRSAGQRT